MTKSLFLTVIVVMGGSGCGSIGGRGDSKFYPGLYPGVRYDAYYLAHRKEVTDFQALWWVGVLDVPLSAGLDTVLLPWDLPYWACNRSSTTNSPPQ